MSANSESIFVWSRGAIKTIQIPIRLFCWVSILHPVNGKATWILLCIFFSRYCAQFCFAIKEIQPSEPRASESLNFLIVRSCFFFLLFCFVFPYYQVHRKRAPLHQCSAMQGWILGNPPTNRPREELKIFYFNFNALFDVFVLCYWKATAAWNLASFLFQCCLQIERNSGGGGERRRGGAG